MQRKLIEGMLYMPFFESNRHHLTSGYVKLETAVGMNAELESFNLESHEVGKFLKKFESTEQTWKVSSEIEKLRCSWKVQLESQNELGKLFYLLSFQVRLNFALSFVLSNFNNGFLIPMVLSNLIKNFRTTTVTFPFQYLSTSA